jgi:aryl-alcohol dehydrogenase-like predicted oxidoreductase
METTNISGIGSPVSRIGLGTWAIGTAPVYDDLAAIDALLADYITDPVGPEFMAPPP